MLNKFLTWLLIKYFLCIKNGVKAVIRSKLKTTKNRVFVVLWSLTLLLGIIAFINITNIINKILPLLLIIITLPILSFIDSNKINRKFLKEKVYGRMGIRSHYPVLSNKKVNKNITHYYFYSNGQKLSTFETNSDLLEFSISEFSKSYCQIIQIKKNDNDRRFFEIITANKQLTDFFNWNMDLIKGYADKQDILLGISHFGEKSFSFLDVPHVLIAGETGGGKGNKTRNFILQLLLQSIRTPLSLVVADFKAGLDYSRFKNIRIIKDKKELKNFLASLIEEMDKRNNILFKSGYENIDEYNKTTQNKLYRYFLIVDELTEAIDIDGLHKYRNKQEIQLRLDIRTGLTTLARLSRAAGIHLILTTQLPSAKVFGNQLKTNVPGRICGRFADDSSSRIVLDSGRATKLPDIKGRMIYKAGANFFEIQTPRVSTELVIKFIRENESKFKLIDNKVQLSKINDNDKLYTLEDYKEINKN